MNGRFEILSCDTYQVLPVSLYSAARDIAERIIAFAWLIILSPVFLAVSAVVAADSSGCIFYTQERNGLNGKIFRLYKFRTMNVSACMEKNIVAAVPGDTRITHVGRFLRKYSIDELPQLLNIVKGDMSFIGPRPLAVAHNGYYARLFDNWEMRHAVKPGLTGLAQVVAKRGAAESFPEMQKRLNLDLYYVACADPVLDLKIALLTVHTLIFPEASRSLIVR